MTKPLSRQPSSQEPRAWFLTSTLTHQGWLGYHYGAPHALVCSDVTVRLHGRLTDEHSFPSLWGLEDQDQDTSGSDVWTDPLPFPAWGYLVAPPWATMGNSSLGLSQINKHSFRAFVLIS